MLKRKLVKKLLATVLSASGVSVICSAQSAVPGADSYTNSARATTNYGGQTSLVVGPGITSYLKFDLSPLPAESTVNKATLRLFVNSVISGGSVDVTEVSAAWLERSLSYRNQPPLGPSATGLHPVTIGSSNLNQFVLIDITSLVQHWMADPAAYPNYGVALVLQGSTGSFSFDSKESTSTSHHPELEIAIAGPAGPQGPQGPPGTTGAAGPAGPVGATGLQGPQGLTGLPGPMGPVGEQGPAGPQGPAGSNATSFNFRQAFDASASYVGNDVVTFGGSSYIAIANSSGPDNPTPDLNTASWSLLARQGLQGLQGSPGPAGVMGPAGPEGSTGLQGPQGAVGLPGPTGPVGPQGPVGPEGPAGSNATSFNFRQAFDASASYVANDVVTFGGSAYIAIVTNSGPDNPTPDLNTASWSLLAQEGSQGPLGPQGPQGVAGPAGPVGATGLQGPQGPMGITGPSGPSGPSGPQGIAGPQGAAGPAGPQGPPGPAAPTIIVASGLTAGYVYATGPTGLVPAQMNSTRTNPAVCFATSPTQCQLSGYVSASGLAVGAIYYVSTNSAGGLTSIKPSASGTCIQVFGQALSSNVLLVTPSPDYGCIQ